MSHPRRVLGPIVLALLASGWESRADEPAQPIDYARQVRPILSRNCFPCHGQDEGKRAGGLRLDVREAATRPLDDGATAIVPGDVDSSELIFRITEEDETVGMPPKESGNRLTSEEVAVLTRWVEEGAPYAGHWSLTAPTRHPLPRIERTAWPRNGIDHFIARRLEDEGLAPSREADRFILLRRASFDLRGLPPSPEEVAAFANDTAPDAYERAVDRFLDDPAYGERWARVWLDLARYADSAGYGSDPLRPDVWRYRDWVIAAFNDNVPYDRFTVDQIAGDLVESPTIDQRMATAFHRNTMTNTEGGTDDEEFRVAAIKDRADTTMQVWMGLTLGCAKCHTHKYDPITNEEYYKFYAFFNQSADSDKPDEQPTMPAPTPAMVEANRRIDAEVAELKARLEASTPELLAAQSKWEDELRIQSGWTALGPESVTSANGATLNRQDDQSVLASGANPERDVYTVTARTEVPGITAFRLEALPDPTLPGESSGRGTHGRFVLERLAIETQPVGKAASPPVGRFVRVELPGAKRILSLAEVEVFEGEENLAPRGDASQSSTGFEGLARLAIDRNTDGRYFEAKSTTHTRDEYDPWWEVKLTEARPIDRVVIWNRTDGDLEGRLTGARVQVLDEDRAVLWQAVLDSPPDPSRALSTTGKQAVVLARAEADLTANGFKAADVIAPASTARKGWSVGSNQKEPHALVVVASQPLARSPIELTFRLEQGSNDTGANLGRFRFSVTTDPAAVRRLGVPEEVLASLDRAPADRSENDRSVLARHFRSIAPELKPVRDEIARLEKSRPKIPNLPVMVELPSDQRRVTHLLRKSNFLDPGQVVTPGVPASLHAMAPGSPENRLGLARWLVAPENPLTARVTVNRFWSRLFGTGIVETEEDFGTQGELPSHPELLDWLAVWYRDSGWDTKALLKLMVTSATYRQSSAATPEALARDPNNRLVGHMPRIRLEAEMVRDQALALAGLLSRKVGGPSVFPPQPEGLWQAAFNGQRTWSTSEGDDRYRRGLYIFWRRTVPYPSMATFDAPSRETCTLRRSRTNNPLQALVTLNDPVFVECAQALARRIQSEGGSSPEERVAFGLRLALCRPPHPEQIAPLVELYQLERARYAADPKAALALATEPIGPLPDGMDAAEAAAWTAVANVLLNLDAVLTKG